MSKYLMVFVFMIVCAGSLSADSPDAVFSQPYSDSVDSVLQAASLADDFVPAASGDVQAVVLWMQYSEAKPSELYIKITENTGASDPNSGTVVVYGDAAATHVDTGDDFGGRDIFKTTCILSSIAALSSGTAYWLEVGTPVGAYWCMQEPLVFGSAIWAFKQGLFITSKSFCGTDYDSFFELLSPVALDRNSWGSIKASF